MSREFSTSVAAQISGASARMLDHWARTNLLPPSGRVAAGKGSRRRYTFQDLVGIRAVLELRRRQCPLQQIRAAVGQLRKFNPQQSTSETLARLTLLTDGRRVYLLTDEHRAMDILTRQTVWALPLGRHILETAERVRRLPSTWVEETTIRGKVYRIQVSGNQNGSAFVGQCRELPGAVGEAATPDGVTLKVAESIEAVLSVMDRQNAPGRTKRPVVRTRESRRHGT